MIICGKLIQETNMNLWDIGTSVGTLALALLTFLLFRAARKQLTSARIQATENIILKQIDFHYHIIDNVKNSIPNEQNIFHFLYVKRLKQVFDNDNGFYNDDEQGRVNKINNAYKQVYEDYGYILGHYFRNLHRIFKKIDEIDVKGFDKNHYAKLVRSQLSEYELLLLFYNCIWVEDDFKLKVLVQKFAVLEGINYEKLLMKDSHKKLYDEKAFGDDLF